MVNLFLITIICIFGGTTNKLFNGPQVRSFFPHCKRSWRRLATRQCFVENKWNNGKVADQLCKPKKTNTLTVPPAVESWVKYGIKVGSVDTLKVPEWAPPRLKFAHPRETSSNGSTSSSVWIPIFYGDKTWQRTPHPILVEFRTPQ
jgi:hypothetical protein